MNIQSESDPHAIGTTDDGGPSLNAADIAIILNCVDHEYGAAPWPGPELVKDFELMAAEITRLRHKLGMNDLSRLAEQVCWGETSGAEVCIDEATPDPRFRRFLYALNNNVRAGDDLLEPSVLSAASAEAGLSDEEVEHYVRELSAAFRS